MSDRDRTVLESQERARTATVGTRFSDVRWVADTGSTNEDVIELARQGAAEGIVVVADHQSAGRGRRGRSWQSPRGGSLMATVLLRPPAAVAALTTFALSLAASAAIDELVGVEVGLKWPNDLVWPGDGAGTDRKLAGILAEADWPTGAGAADGWRQPAAGERVVVAAGIGVNVAWGDEVPEELADRAVALDGIVPADRVPDRADLLAAILRGLEVAYVDLLGGGGPAALLDRWRSASATIGRRVRVDLGSEDVVGTAVDLSEQGHLVVRTDEGSTRTLAVGDVVHLRSVT